MDDKVTREQECEGRYFTAQWLLLDKQVTAARELLQSAETACPRGFYERAGAIAELRNLAR